jgi:hypothetical protein
MITWLMAAMACIGDAGTARCTCTPGVRSVVLADEAAVFDGTVLSRREQDGAVVVTLRVARRWKGAATDTVTVRTTDAGRSCGFPFETGRRYLVAAGSHDGRLVTGRCLATRAWDAEADRIAKALGAPVSGARAQVRKRAS